MQARLLSVREIAPQVRHFVFEVPGQADFRFVPGQFVSITETLHGKKVTRPYSIASAPDGNRFELCLNLVPEGLMSPWLFSLEPGALVEIRPPLGMFVLRTPPREAVFVATGTGVAPFRSMILAEQAAPEPRPMTLIFGVRYEASLLYREEFEARAACTPSFRFWPTLSRPGENWTGRTGHVQNHLDEALGGRRDLDVYICGLKLMVDDVRERLKAKGFDRKQIVYEKYD
jgi:CDP-4-dehydro-6-deoxyglucose reductase